MIGDAITGGERYRLHGHSGEVFDISVSSDSRFIASGSRDRKIIIWDMDTRQDVMCLRGHDE